MLKRIAPAVCLAAGVMALLFLATPSDPAGAEEFTREQQVKVRELYAQGRGHYLEKQFKESNESYEELLALIPDSDDFDEIRATVRYEVARNHALQGEKEAAFENLERAVENGFQDDEILQKDVDFTALWTNEKFLALVEKVRQRRHEALASVARIPIGLKDLDGKEIHEKDLAGKVVVIDVWGTWCPPCRMEIPHFIRLQSEYEDEGLAVIGLTWENQPPNDRLRDRVQRFAAQNEVNYRMALLTPELLGRIPDLRAFPTTFFVGRDGTVRQRMVGYHNYKDLEAQAKPLLAEPAKKKADETEKASAAGTGAEG